MNLIVCADYEFGIGKNGDLLQKIPEDLKYFKKITMGKTVIMGRTTFESLPDSKPLKGRRNMMLTHNKYYHQDGIEVYNSVEEILEVIKNLNQEDVFVIGGGQIYKQFLPYCKKAYVTRILRIYEADTFFVDIDKDWTLKSKNELKFFEGIAYRFDVYERD